MTYNLSAVASNSTDMVGFLQAMNSVLLNDLLGVLMLFGITTIFFINYFMGTGDIGKALLATSFISTFLAIMLSAIGILAPLYLYIVMIVSALTATFAWSKG